jgi:hypothetical protein
MIAVVACVAPATRMQAQRTTRVSAESFIELNGRRLSPGDEFVVADAPRAPAIARNAEVIWGGVLRDSTRQVSAAEAAGRLVILLPVSGAPIADSTMTPAVEARFRGAFAVAIITENLALLGSNPARSAPAAGAAAADAKRAALIYITPGVASQLLGRETIDDAIEPGTIGKTIRALLRLVD